MFDGIVFITVVLLVLYGFNWLMGYRKGNITLDLENRYTNLNEYVNAVREELEKKGRVVEYIGNHEFTIDGKHYILQERNVPMGGVPLQHTILQRVKEK